MYKKRPQVINWEQISRFLSREMSEKESQAFEEDLATNKELARMVKDADKDWKIIEEMEKLKNQVDVNKAWNILHHRLKRDNLLESSPHIVPSVSWSTMLRIAAMLIIVVGITLGTYKIVYHPRTTKLQVAQTAYNEGGKTITLADGSRVYLNGNSQLRYPEKFASDQRLITLQGEAFFEIERNPQKPFIINANGAQIVVMGTTFNVNTQGKKVEVLVKSGAVQLSLLKSPEKNLILQKGDFGIIDKDIVKKIKHPGNNYLSWKSRYLVFKGENLEEVSRQINHAYQVNIQFSDPSLKKLRLTSVYDQQTLDNILESLCLSFPVQYEKKNNQITLYRTPQ